MIGIGFAAGMSIGQKLLRVGIAVALVASLLAVSYCQGRSDGRGLEQARTQQQIIAALERDRKAREKADAQRVRDEQTRREMEEQYEEAIEAAPGGTNSPAATALACERLRRAYPGRSELLPPECRRGGGD